MADISDNDGQADAAFVSEPGTGRMTPLTGYGALRGRLDFDPRIDLTKPIYEQAQRLERASRGRKPPAANP